MMRASSGSVSSFSSMFSASSAAPGAPPAARAPWRSRCARLALALALAAPLAACGGEDDDDDGSSPPSSSPIVCTATVSPSSFLYEIGDAGRMLVVAPRTAQEDTLERIGVAAPTIQGSWLAAEQRSSVGKLRTELTFGASSVTVTAICTNLANKTGRVSVNAAATITPTQVTIQGFDTKSVQVQ